MRGHDAADARRNRGAKGNQFQMFQTIFVGTNYRKIDVRVRGGVAMAGKMFSGREAAVFFHAPHEGSDELGDTLGIFAEGARIYNGIIGITVDIGVRGKNPGNANRSC